MDDLNKALNYFKDREFKEAEKILEKYYDKDIPQHSMVISMLSEIYAATGKLKLLYHPTRKQLNLMLEMAGYFVEKKPELAKQIYKKMLLVDSRDPGVWNNIGILYEDIETYDKVIEAYKKSIELAPNLGAYMNLSSYYRVNNQLDEAIYYAEKAMELDPNYKLGNVAIGTSKLAKGDISGYPVYVKFGATKDEWLREPWDGTPHPDKKLLLYCDQGLGDSLMYIRYLPYLAEKFKKVNVAVPPPLRDLFIRSFPLEKYADKGLNFEFHRKPCVVEHDYYVVSLYAPYYLNMDFSQIPASEGYLVADEEKVKYFKEKYFMTKKLKVGLCWRSTSNNERIAVLRNMDLDEMKGLFDIPNVQYYSFQKDRNEQLQKYPQVMKIHRDFNTFDDTLAAAKNLDIMISIDTSVMHVCGAGGVKTIMPLPYGAEWRWFQDTKTTPWYDSVEIYRQTKYKCWTDVIERLIATVRKMAEEHTA